MAGFVVIHAAYSYPEVVIMVSIDYDDDSYYTNTAMMTINQHGIKIAIAMYLLHNSLININ